MKNALVILAGGKGKRFGHIIPKQFYKIGQKTIIEIFLSNLDTEPFQHIVICIEHKYRKIIKQTQLFCASPKVHFVSAKNTARF